MSGGQIAGAVARMPGDKDEARALMCWSLELTNPKLGLKKALERP